MQPVLGRPIYRSGVIRGAKDVQACWRSSVARLTRQDFGKCGIDEAYRGRLLACRPTFVYDGRGRSCNRALMCPFCWARKASAWWEVVDRAFFGVDPKPRRRAEGLSLGVITRLYRVPYAAQVFSDGLMVNMLRNFYTARVRGAACYAPDTDCRWFSRKAEVAAGLKAAGPAAGCFEVASAELARDRETWTASVHQVWLLPAGTELPAITPKWHHHARRQLVESPSRTAVMKAVARACRYPRAMIMPDGDGTHAIQMLEARQGIRTTSTAGSFCRKKPGGSRAGSPGGPTDC